MKGGEAGVNLSLAATGVPPFKESKESSGG